MVLLVSSIVLFLAIFAIKVSDKSGIPSLLLFIVLGMAFNVMGVQFNNYIFADKFVTIALMIIMFQGGFSTKWKMAKPVAAPAIVYSSLGVIMTAIITGLFGHYVLKMSLYEGMLLGSIIGSTDYSSVSGILRSKNLNLKYSTAPLLELESGSNDPFAYTMTMIFLSVLLGKPTNVFLMILQQVGLGVILGFLFAYAFYYLIEKTNMSHDGLFIIYIVATSLLVYSFTAFIGGNGFLAVYIYGIYIGNKSYKGKRETVFFYEGLADLMQIGMFFMLGILSDWSEFIRTLPFAAAVMMFMFIVARPLSIYVLGAPFKLKNNQKLIISLAGLRGAAAIAFAVMSVNSGVQVSGDIYNTVFGICVLSLIVQGSLMPSASKKLDMLDPNDTVLKTFNDYQDRSEIGFIQTKIFEDSRWVGKKVKDLNLAFNVIVAKISRMGKTIVPKGDTEIKEGDIIVLGGETYFDPTGKGLVEFTVGEQHPFYDKKVKDLDLDKEHLIVIIQRESGDIIVPQGDTLIQGGDVLVTLNGD